MNRLSDDLLQYLRCHKLADRQKQLIRELAIDIKRQPKTAGEYAATYARRTRRIQGFIN